MHIVIDSEATHARAVKGRSGRISQLWVSMLNLSMSAMCTFLQSLQPWFSIHICGPSKFVDDGPYAQSVRRCNSKVRLIEHQRGQGAVTYLSRPLMIYTASSTKVDESPALASLSWSGGEGKAFQT